MSYNKLQVLEANTKAITIALTQKFIWDVNVEIGESVV